MDVVDVLRFLTVVLTGLATGNLLMMLVVIIPTLHTVAPGVEVQLHQRLQRRIDRYNPVFFVLALLAAIAILFIADDASATTTGATSVGLLGCVGVIVVSRAHVDRVRHRADAAAADSDGGQYIQLRTGWESGHAIRTAFGIVAFISFAIAAVSV